MPHQHASQPDRLSPAMRTCVVMPPGKPVANRAKVLRLLEFLMCKATPVPDQRWSDVTLVLTHDRGIQKINRIHLGRDDSTDVITYSYDPLPGTAPIKTSGEIFVNVELARRMGTRFGGADRELALYMAHGCDHLAGEDDRTPRERQRMRRRELRWLAEASRLGLLAGLITV